MSKTLTSLALAALAASCGPGTPKPDPIVKTPVTADAAVEEPTTMTELERLRAQADQDPLLQPWTGPHGGVPPWDRLDASKFPAAFTTGLALLAAEIQAIDDNPDPATFDNTFVPYLDAGRHEDRAETLFGVATGNMNTEEFQALDMEWSPKLTAAYDAIYFDAKLFARIQKVYDDRASLTAEQQRLVELTYDRFVQAGAKLTADQKAQMGAINQELATLFTTFSQKLQADESTYIVLAEADLAGLPEDFAANLKDQASGEYRVANTRSVVDEFLSYSSRRDLREKVWRAFKNRGDNGDANDTNETIARIVKLRAERAALLGYASHAHKRMADTMAKDPEKANELMMRVWAGAKGRVKEEVADMQKLARKEKGNKKLTIEPWDYLYYAQKVKKAKYDLDQSEVKKYFQLDHIIEASYFMANKLYGLKFVEITGTVPVFHPDVRVFEVSDETTGNFLGMFYRDDYARTGLKRSGAWQSTYRGHETFKGTVTPIASNNNNFMKPTDGKPTLISLDDARTLFHEFGHAIHALVSEVNYPGLGTTPRDFVEYPSQVHEMWVMTKPILDRFCLHVDTGKPMPADLVAKIEKSAKFNQGYATGEFMASAIVDMKLHTIADGVIDPDKFEAQTLKEIGVPKEIVMRHRLPQFGHLFSSDAYSAGYYSYLWSAVMDADTREAFLETGDVFDKATADKMRKYILAPGNSTDRAEAYRQFRGRDPDVNALLRLRGFPVKSTEK